MFAQAHLQTALQLVESYKGGLPFVHFTKQYFSSHKKHGSRDRKQILQLCYSWFRLGHALQHWPAEERMLAGLFLTSTESNRLLTELREDWGNAAAESLTDKCQRLGITMGDLQIFAWTNALSAGIDPTAMHISHLKQPHLFVRIRKGHRDKVIRRLEEKWIDYREPVLNALQLPQGYDVNKDFLLNKELVIQDLSSQRTGELMRVIPVNKSPLKIWDCCAASGGKSLLAVDIFSEAEITVTDIRSSILSNLAARFLEAGVSKYKRVEADLSSTTPDIPLQDIIIADLPCTGSGTWARAPENLYHFNSDSIRDFVLLQRKIAANAITKLSSGGYFLYITCSAFRQENEENVQWLQAELKLELIEEKLINGILQQADTMFMALLRRQ